MMLFLCMQMLMAAPVESPIRLAAQLAKDGEIARAESVLLDIDVEHQTRDVVLLHVTLGLIALKKDLPREALKNFIQARELFSEKTEGGLNQSPVQFYKSFRFLTFLSLSYRMVR